jgi:hypothetical protein
MGSSIVGLSLSTNNGEPENFEIVDYGPDIEAMQAQLQEVDQVLADHIREHPSGGSGEAWVPKHWTLEARHMPIITKVTPDGSRSRIELGSEGYLFARYLAPSPYQLMYYISIGADGLNPAPDPKGGEWQVWMPSVFHPNTYFPWSFGNAWMKNKLGSQRTNYYGMSRISGTGDTNWPWCYEIDFPFGYVKNLGIEGRSFAGLNLYENFSPAYRGMNFDFRFRGGDRMYFQGIQSWKGLQE